MKKILAFCIMLAIGVFSVGCVAPVPEGAPSSQSGADSSDESSSDASVSSEEPESSEVDITDTSPLSEGEIKEMYTDPDRFIGRTVSLTGKVFSEPDHDSEGIYFQMFTDIKNYDGNTIVAYLVPDFELESDDYVKLTGMVAGKFEGKNAYGGTVTAPQVIATELEKASYADVMAPALKTVTLKDASATQYGYTVAVTKVEFAENETRVYVTVKNGGSDTFNLYSFNTKIVQNGKQYEEEYNYDADYPEVQTDLLPGVTTEGIILFPKLEQKDFQIVLDASSEDYSEDIEPYSFNIPVK